MHPGNRLHGYESASGCTVAANSGDSPAFFDAKLGMEMLETAEGYFVEGPKNLVVGAGKVGNPVVMVMTVYNETDFILNYPGGVLAGEKALRALKLAALKAEWKRLTTTRAGQGEAAFNLVLIVVGGSELIASKLNIARLEARAAAIQEVLDPIAQTRRTTAIVQTTDGTKVVAAGGRDLSAAQRAALGPGEVAAPNVPGAHAEITALQGVYEGGMTPSVLVTSRPICPGCMVGIDALGGTAASQTVVIFVVNPPIAQAAGAAALLNLGNPQSSP